VLPALSKYLAISEAERSKQKNIRLTSRLTEEGNQTNKERIHDLLRRRSKPSSQRKAKTTALCLLDTLPRRPAIASGLHRKIRRSPVQSVCPRRKSDLL
jgi:hypothetical protein